MGAYQSTDPRQQDIEDDLAVIDQFNAERAIAYRPQPGDVLFFECEHDLCEEDIADIARTMKRLIPGVEVVVLSGGIKVSVAHTQS